MKDLKVRLWVITVIITIHILSDSSLIRVNKES